MPTPLIDYTSPAWLSVAAYLRERIETLRKANDGDLDPVETARLRGQLKALKEVLGLPDASARERQPVPDPFPGLSPPS